MNRCRDLADATIGPRPNQGPGMRFDQLDRLIMRAACALLPCLPFSSGAGELPHHWRVEEAYFACAASHSLQGGIFGKGPVRRFGPRPGACAAAEWSRISLAEFKALATSWYGIDWQVDIGFFSREPASGASATGPAQASSQASRP